MDYKNDTAVVKIPVLTNHLTSCLFVLGKMYKYKLSAKTVVWISKRLAIPGPIPFSWKEDFTDMLLDYPQLCQVPDSHQ